MSLKILSAEHMEDCSQGDFRLYFTDGAMVFNISPLKTRIFIPSGDFGGLGAGTIGGTYLSREQEWKDKTVKFDTWFKTLKYVPPFPIGFNLGTNSAGYWDQNISKGAGGIGYKKAFPVHSTQKLQVFGIVTAKEKALQNIVFHAFGKIYNTEDTYHLAHPEVAKRGATWTREELLVDLVENALYFRGTHIGTVTSSPRAGFRGPELRITLKKSCRHLYGLVREGGVDSSRVNISGH